MQELRQPGDAFLQLTDSRKPFDTLKEETMPYTTLRMTLYLAHEGLTESSYIAEIGIAQHQNRAVASRGA